MALPAETYRDIIQHVSDKRDLRNLLYTSRILKHEAERRLLRTIDLFALDLYRVPNPFSPEQLTGIFEHLCRYPELAAAVHEVNYTSDIVSDELVEAVFPLMTNLTRLHLSYSFHPILTRCTFRLKCLVWYGKAEPRWENDMAEFLNTQSSVTELDLDTRIKVPSSALPNIKILHCGSKGTELLHNRRITRLKMSTTFGAELFSDPECLGHLRVLTCFGLNDNFDWSLLRNLDYLAVSEVPIPGIQSITSPIKHILRQNENIIHWISYMPKLRKLVVSLPHLGLPHDNPSAHAMVVPRAHALFRDHRNLESITFEVWTLAANSRRVFVFGRDCLPIFVGAPDPDEWRYFRLEG